MSNTYATQLRDVDHWLDYPFLPPESLIQKKMNEKSDLFSAMYMLCDWAQTRGDTELRKLGESGASINVGKRLGHQQIIDAIHQLYVCEMKERNKVDEEKSKNEKENENKARVEKEKMEKEKKEKASLEKEKVQKELEEKVRVEKEKLKKEKEEKARMENEKAENEIEEKSKADKEKENKAKFERVQTESEKLKKEKAEKEKEKKAKEECVVNSSEEVTDQMAIIPNVLDKIVWFWGEVKDTYLWYE